MYNNIYMDYNSPIYREKYLKYKKKYTALRNLEVQQGSGMFGFGSVDPTKAHNKEMKRKLDEQIKDAKKLIEPLVSNKKNFEKKQKEEVMKDFKEMTTVTLPGLIKNNTEVKPNVETPDAVTHLKELMDSKLDGKTLSEWAVGKSADKPKDSSAPTDKKDAAPGDIKDAAQVGGAQAEGTDGKVEGNDSKEPPFVEIKCEYEGKVKEALCKMHVEVSKNVKSRAWLKNNIKETTIDNMAEQIGMMNVQIGIDKLCEDLVKTSNAKEADNKDCNENKKKAYTHLKEIMTKLNKFDSGRIQKDKKNAENWTKAQATLNESAKKYLAAAGDLGKELAPKDSNHQATIEEVKELQKLAILNYKNNLNTKLELSLAEGEEVNMDNIISHLVSTDVTIDEPKLKKIQDMKKTVEKDADSPTSETESPTDESKEKVIANEDKKAAEEKVAAEKVEAEKAAAKKKYYY